MYTGKNNPYLVLEHTWQMTKNGRTGSSEDLDQLSIRPVSPLSSSCDSGAGGAKLLNLSALCISNILLLEDRHLPSIFIRMYEQCLLMNEQDETNEENKSRLRLLNYLIQRWHETRTRLNFFRDLMRVAGALAKPIIGDHLSIAVEETKVTQYHVMSELMKNLRAETAGRTLGEYLESYSGSKQINQYTFNDMALELFSRNDVLSYERSSTSWIGDLSMHPLASYGKRVIVVLMRAICRLKLNVPPSVSAKLFAPSLPSWVEEDTDTGMINCDEATKLRISQAKENITRMLLRRKDKLGVKASSSDTSSNTIIFSARKDSSTSSSTDEVDPVSKVDGYLDKVAEDDIRVDNNMDNIDTPASPFEQRHMDQSDDHQYADDDLADDLRTVDTESFIGFADQESRSTVIALQHMEETVQRVNEVDKKFRESDRDLLLSLRDVLEVGATKDDAIPASPNRNPFEEIRTPSFAAEESLNEEASHDTVADIRAKDRDLSYLARSGYDDALTMELESLDDQPQKPLDDANPGSAHSVVVDFDDLL